MNSVVRQALELRWRATKDELRTFLTALKRQRSERRNGWKELGRARDHAVVCLTMLARMHIRDIPDLTVDEIQRIIDDLEGQVPSSYRRVLTYLKSCWTKYKRLASAVSDGQLPATLVCYKNGSALRGPQRRMRQAMAGLDVMLARQLKVFWPDLKKL